MKACSISLLITFFRFRTGRLAGGCSGNTVGRQQIDSRGYARRKSAKKKNSLLIKAVEAANFPQDRFQPTTIVNTDDAIFGTGYFVVGKIEKNKRRYPWAQFIIDGNGQGRVAWRLPEQSSTILVLNKAGQIQWAKDGSLTPE